MGLEERRGKCIVTGLSNNTSNEGLGKVKKSAFPGDRGGLKEEGDIGDA